MKTRTVRARSNRSYRHDARLQSSCSLLVLAGLGLLSFSLPHEALAQRVVAPGTVPVLRAVVSGQAVVNAPVAGAARPLMTIDQATQRAIIDWNSFDIGSSAEVLFRHQMGSTASTLNRIHSADPSVIQGRLSSTGPVVRGQATAGGQIILINQNGILFDRGSQVNTQSLVASTLNLSNERFQSGALNGGGLTSPAFEGGYDAAGNTLPARPDGSRPGDIVIGGGLASAAAPLLQAGAGGSIMIFAPSIDNQSGIIKAPDGQVILAAGSKAYLAINPDENDITLRGYVVEVEADAAGPGLNLTSLVRNGGEITADRGNVTLAALAVNQEGRVSAKTALQANGSIYLKAHTKDQTQSGTVLFASGSVTEVTPDADDKTTSPQSQSYELYRGVIDASGRTIENHGSVKVPGGLIKLNASSTSDPTGARVYLAQGSETSVAGAWADVDFTKNLQTFRVTSNELKNSPDQKTGILRGAEVTVDLRQNNEILDLSGYRGLIARTVAEKAAAGGEMQIASTGSVIQREGAVIDASGGGYRYNGGMVRTTRLLGADGKVYDIANAPEGQPYTQLLDNYQRVDTRWGQTISIANPQGMIGTYQAASTEGQAGGLVTIKSQAGLVLDGTLKGGVTVGAQQLGSAPRGATLQIGLVESLAANRLFDDQLIGNLNWRQTASDTLGAAFGAGSVLTAAQRQSFTLGADQVFGASRQTSDGIVQSGFGTVDINSNGRIALGPDVSITSDAGASLNLRAKQVDVAGEIRLAGGHLLLASIASDNVAIAPELEPDNVERVIVRSGATLSTAGAWVNNSSPDGSFIGAPAASGLRNADGGTTRAIDGGSITIAATSAIDHTRLEHGAVLDVGGGAAMGSNQKVTAGDGGRLSIANGAQDQINPDWLQADLRGFAMGKGGELTLKLGHADIVANGVSGLLPEASTRLQAGLFADNGFSKLNIEAANGIDIASGTAIAVEQKNLVIDPGTARRLATGGNIAMATAVQRLPDWQRGAASVSLNAKGGGQPLAATLNLRAGATIVTDPKGTIALAGVDGVEVNGRLSAPGGQIGVSLNGPVLPLSAPDLHIGSQAAISTAGTFVRTPNDRGLVQGTLVDGGSITLDARGAGLQIDTGARLDVSGVSQTVDVTTTGRSPRLTRQTLDGQAGSLIVRSQGDTVLGGTMLAQGGSPNAAGGSFALELMQPEGQASLPDERRIVVTSGAQAVSPAPGMVDAQVNVSALEAGGFEKLRLQSENRIAFQGSATLDFERGVRLDAPLIEVDDAARVNLRGANVALGQSLGARVPTTDASANVTLQITDGAASPALATRAGTGVLSVEAGAVDLYGNLTVNGTQLTRIASDSDIRLVGRSTTLSSESSQQNYSSQVGSLTTAGNIELDAAQIYPATRTDYGIAVKDALTGALVDGGRIDVASNGQTAGTAYSAGGRLSLQADTIHQAGTVKAPLGEIALNAGTSLELAPGSVTSVSGAGTTVLYGGTNAGTIWQYKEGTATLDTTLSAVTDEGKHLSLSAPNVDVQAGATVDLRGGGDVLGVEFVPGNGGDRDVTLADNTFAIIPAAGLKAMPYDYDTLSLKDPGVGFSMNDGRDKVLYDSIRLGSGAVVPAGDYVLLPARYALLPGAYLVQLQTGAAYRNLQAGQNTTLANGQVVLAAHRSAIGTGVQESQSIGVIVRPGAAAAQQASDYNLSSAAFFADAATVARVAAPSLPWDAGRLLVDNASTLALDGRFQTAAGAGPAQATGRIADIDINAQRIAVVDHVGDTTVPADFLQIEGGALSGLGGSVLLGGKRSHTDNGIRITTGGEQSEVLVANSQAGAVTLPELTLAAGQRIDIRAGSMLSATGVASGDSPAVISTEASGALVRLSNGAQAQVDRGVASNERGDVQIAGGASLSASSSLLVDGTRAMASQGSLRAGGAQGAGGSLSLSSVQVNLGETANAALPLSGLVLSNSDLAEFVGLDELVLRGYGAIDLMGNTSFGSSALNKLTLDTPLLQGRIAADGLAPQATIGARELTLANTADTLAVASTGTGSLLVNADRLQVGVGHKAVSGFSEVRLAASETVAVQGEGDLKVAAALTVDTPRVVAEGGSHQTLSAVDTSTAGAATYSSLSLTGASAASAQPDTRSTQLGGRLALEGSSVTVATTVAARSGQIAIAAHGTASAGGVTLADGGVLDARGQAKDFNGTVVTADGGSVALHAGSGEVNIANGAKVDVSAAAAGGSAGRVALSSDTLALNGELAGRAGTGATSGSIALDLGSLADVSELNTRLNSGGFAEERQLRLRSGDIAVASSDQIAARRVTLAADGGRIDVAGQVGSGAPQGGAQVNLYARDGISMAAGGQIVAGASDAGARGGEVRVATRNGELVFDRDAVIDVRAGHAGPAGSVTFGVSRDETNVMGATRLEGRVLRGSGATQASVDVEATRRYDVSGSTDVTAGDIAAYAADHMAFVSADQSSVTSGLRDDTGAALSGARVLGATELNSGGDLALGSPWDLTTAQWLADGKPGTLTVRAAGNLTLSQSLGSPGDDILAGDTWNLRLVAGADLGAANPMAVLPFDGLAAGRGSLLLSGANAKLRTGTGRIDLAAARDLRIDNVAATIYTAGRIGAEDTESNGNNRWAVDGGGISIQAGGAIDGASVANGELWITEWMRRNRQSNVAFAALQPTDWWAYRPRFQQGVGTLAGGDIEINAGGNIANLSAMLPTSGRTWRDADDQRQVDVQGGGNLSVRSGGDVIGSSFLVARGEGRVDAAGDIGAERRTQLYVMGASSGDVPEGAQIALVAGGQVALQSVNNPTALKVNVKDASDPARGPSFNASGNFATFFTYTGNSRADAIAKSGDLSYEAKLAPGAWRTFNRISPITSVNTDVPGAFPASLSFVAFEGNMSAPLEQERVTTFPSAQATVSMLAGQSMFNIGFYGSDRDPETIITPTTSFENANSRAVPQLVGTTDLRPSGAQGRILVRDASTPYTFELQALDGSFLSSDAATGVVFTAPGRVRAGVDVVGASLQFQNLGPDDQSEVRADTGDLRSPIGIEVRGPGRLVLQAGRNIDLGKAAVLIAGGSSGGVVASGNAGNPQLPFDKSARITMVAGVAGNLDLAKLDDAYAEIVALNKASSEIIDLYRQLGTEASDRVLSAGSIAQLAQADPAYQRFVALDTAAPRALAAYQAALRADSLPLGGGVDSAAAASLYRLLNGESDLARLQSATSVAALGGAYAAYADLDQRYPRLFTDYVQRRSKGALPTGVSPIVFSDALAAAVAEVVPNGSVSGGNIFSYQTSIQTFGGSDIDLLAPAGDIVVGLTTPPSEGTTIGVLTNAGGAIRSVSAGDFAINKGKVLTAQGGDILLFSSQGSIDAGRGAKTSLSTPPPKRTPILDADGNQIGVRVSIPTSAAGSGIQTLTSDPDGLGPLVAPRAGDVFLFAPAGTIDAGEAGIRSSGNIVLNAQTVLNASNISSSGSSQGVPVAVSGSLASSVASSGGAGDGGAKAAQDAAKNAAEAARAATASGVQKPSILTVEVLGFGENNCKEQEKDCFAK